MERIRRKEQPMESGSEKKTRAPRATPLRVFAAVLDALQRSAGDRDAPAAMADDAQIASLRVDKRWIRPGEAEGVTITIERMDPQQEALL